MAWRAAWRLGALIVTVGCGSTSPAAPDRTTATTSVRVPAAQPGEHRFVVHAEAMAHDRPLTIGLHPGPTSIEVEAPGERVEVTLDAPAALDHGSRRPALYLGWR